MTARKNAKTSSAQPTASKASARPGIHRASDLAWKDGSGSLKGVKVAVVSEDRDTGAKAMFIKLPPNKGAAAAQDEYHYHPVATHTLIIEGTVNTVVDGKRVTGKAGDYFRSPANWAHADSGSDVGATMFIITEGSRGGKTSAKFETVSVNSARGAKAAAISSAQPTASKASARPGIHRASDLAWKDGSGSLKGVKVAVVSEDRDTGAKAMFIKLPPNKGAAAAQDEYHYHPVATHTLIIEGTVNTVVDGKRVTGKAGDYFRSPANWAHADSGSEVGATMFIITEGSRRGAAAKFGTVAAKD